MSEKIPSEEPLLPVVGWREWVALPGLGVRAIKAKIDTGACSSSLHATNMQIFERDGRDWIRFQLTASRRKSEQGSVIEVPVLEFRNVRSSSGQTTLRPVIETELAVLGKVWKIELTLANRTRMKFRMLLGRAALRSHVLVDPARSYRIDRPRRRRSRRSER